MMENENPVVVQKDKETGMVKLVCKEIPTKGGQWTGRWMSIRLFTRESVINLAFNMLYAVFDNKELLMEFYDKINPTN